MRSPRVNRSAVFAACSTLFVISLIFLARGTNASQSGGMDAMSIDLDVTGNTATSLGPREECVVVSPGDTVTLDVTAEGIPGASPMMAFTYELHSPAGMVSVIASDTNYLLASAPRSDVLNVEGPTPDDDGRWAGSALDLNTPALEDGSGVLARLTIGVSDSATPGLLPLDLSHGIHIDPMNNAWLAREHRSAYLAVATDCANLPTPHGTAIPTEPPTGIRVGIDHDGAPEDINTGPLVVPPGARFSVQIVGYWPDRQDAQAQVTAWFDREVVEARNCDQCSGLHEGWIEVGGLLPGAEGYRVLTSVGFEAAGSAGECTKLRVIPDSAFHADAVDGEVCIDPDAPLPTPTPTPPPTPTPGSITPTTTPHGPPTTAPTRTATPTQSPAPTATPSATPTPSVAPTAVPLAAALPATGGPPGGGSVTPVGGLAAVVVAWTVCVALWRRNVGR